ncbi:MAG: DUF2147 domain-containing protein [Hyphomicrobiales bacterium]|nr:MAG: DUF2147 domain-containing protein [Hyphomicrobiales bacterium]
MTRTLKWLAAIGIATLSVAPAYALAASATPVGSWQVTTGEARYKITACGDDGELCAKLIWLRDDQRTDENLAVLNKYVVQGAERATENKWEGNVLFEGRSYDGTMTLVSKNYMTLKGCSGILCQTYELTRI